MFRECRRDIFLFNALKDASLSPLCLYQTPLEHHSIRSVLAWAWIRNKPIRWILWWNDKKEKEITVVMLRLLEGSVHMLLNFLGSLASSFVLVNIDHTLQVMLWGTGHRGLIWKNWWSKKKRGRVRSITVLFFVCSS